MTGKQNLPSKLGRVIRSLISADAVRCAHSILQEQVSGLLDRRQISGNPR
jgi:hypothetical protein